MIRNRAIEAARVFHVDPAALKKAREAKQKKAAGKLNAARIKCNKELKRMKCYCFCEQPETDDMVGCDRRMMCPFRGWLHEECAQLHKPVVEGDPYWCFWCDKYGVLFEKAPTSSE